MKNRIIFIVAAMLTIAAILLHNVYNSDNTLAQLEKAREIAVSNGEDYVVAKGKNIEVYNSDVQQIMHQYTYWNTGGTYDDAVNAIAEKAVVAYYAEKAGVIVTDEEVREYIDLQKSASENAANYAEFEAFVKAGRMTADEYWDAQYNILRMELLCGKFDEYTDKSSEERKNYAVENLNAEKIVILK